MAPELFVLAGGFAALGAHPFTIYPASLALLPHRYRKIDTSLGETPSELRVALCVCAYNEESIIRKKAENMLRMREAWPDLELMIYVDAATDRTAELLREYEDRIRVMVATERHGKTHGMNSLVAATTADIVVFSDANVMFAPDAIPRLLSPFADAKVGCVCGHLIYTSAADTSTAATGSLYWRLEEAIKSLESGTGSTMGADGSIFAIRRTLHHPPPAHIIDDMFVSLSILCDGYRVVRAADALAYEETVSRPTEEFRRKVRIACQAFNVHRLLWPRLRRLSALDQYKYVSHKLLRWLSGDLFVLAGVAFLAALADIGAWDTLVACIAFAAAFLTAGILLPSSIPGRLLEIAAALLATSIGVLRSVRGDHFQTWTPPASARSRD
jgi:cellulose synthase/poly-beta-1,6-N-acetylglucosamine synthase-like glycosyltransferase